MREGPGLLGGLEFCKLLDPQVYDAPTMAGRAVPVGGAVSVLPANPQEMEKDVEGESDTNNQRPHQPCNKEIMVEELCEFLGLMRLSGQAAEHAFGPRLKKWAVEGVPVDCGKDWAVKAIIAAVEQGLHPTARTEEAIKLFEEDIGYQIKADFARVVPWEQIYGKSWQRRSQISRSPWLWQSPRRNGAHGSSWTCRLG